jgi:hypothetical protein
LDFDPSAGATHPILLDTLVDSDQAYVNGVLVGSTDILQEGIRFLKEF